MTTHFFLSNLGLRIWRWFFGKKPTGDQGTFKLMLFAEGNGCSPDLMCTWILLSQAWNDAKTAEKRSKQIDFIADKTWNKKGRVGFISILIMANSCYLMANRRNVYPFPFTKWGTLVVCALRTLLFKKAKISLICALHAVFLRDAFRTRNTLVFCALRALKKTFMDRQHSLVMNIHGRRIVRLVQIDAPPSGLSGVRWKTF